jgi:hypothetical protein
MSSAEPAPSRIRRRRSRYRKVDELDLRTRAGRRARELIRVFETALGGAITDGQRLAVHRAALLTSLAEDKRARSLAGEPINLDDLVRIDRLAMQAVRLLGIDLLSQPKSVPSLADYVRSKSKSEGITP